MQPRVAREVQKQRHVELMNTLEAAQYLGVTPRTLEVWRCTKRHAIPYIKVGRLVRYCRVDLDDWMASRTVDACEVAQ